MNETVVLELRAHRGEIEFLIDQVVQRERKTSTNNLLGEHYRKVWRIAISRFVAINSDGVKWGDA